MTSRDDLERRVAELEREVAELRRERDRKYYPHPHAPHVPYRPWPPPCPERRPRVRFLYS
jgi:hypothetical protein